MRRPMFCILLYALTAVGGVLAVAACVLWIRSHCVPEHLSWYRQVGNREAHQIDAVRVVSAGGRLACNLQRQRFAGFDMRTDMGENWKFSRHTSAGLRVERVMSLKAMDVRSASFLGARFTHYTRDGGTAASNSLAPGQSAADAWVIVLPYAWILAITICPTAVLLARSMIRRLLLRNAGRTGLCPSCGYDLRASPGRCPECGAIPPRQPRASCRSELNV